MQLKRAEYLKPTLASLMWVLFWADHPNDPAFDFQIVRRDTVSKVLKRRSCMTTFVTEGGGSHLPNSSIEEKINRINSWPLGQNPQQPRSFL